ncbi:MAG TPA: 30S ribosomal protein S15 [Candidatus Nanoarchaeia archaeon]|nr:30S ribosomal protein S15 [Candidatus Nanoarchaeia archaeon]
MARMYSRRKGKSGSKTPPKRVPSWAPYKSKEVEKLIQKMGKAGKSASEIGLILRDSYGINSVKALTGKKVNTLLKEHGITKTLPEDMLALIKKLISIKTHLEQNKQDQTAKRGHILTSSRIRRLAKYYQRSKVLESDWVLNLDRLKIYLE